MIQLLESKQWKLGLEEENQKYRFVITHEDFIKITTSFMEFDKEMLKITQKTLKEIAKEIEQGKTKSEYESLELFEDLTGNFLLTIHLGAYHNFTLYFINYSADFQLDFAGRSYELVQLRDTINLIIEEQSFYD
ncbi:hypothetical protein QWY14_04100 [Planococcus sp. N028]|uniref:Uncharacterized protein n=1 Tax=Planococcus shixiaomingii TaxID=3058393 RepID=A0ABT8MZ92_9BACL|nr:hypothetical protein [Planococcus sp. N028]MDN7240956.1 hypothetical protein [Planococcus sp. N028]